MLAAARPPARKGYLAFALRLLFIGSEQHVDKEDYDKTSRGEYRTPNGIIFMPRTNTAFFSSMRIYAYSSLSAGRTGVDEPSSSLFMS